MLNRMPSIEQFRQIVKNIKHSAQFVDVINDEVILNTNAKLPVLDVTGTCKIHGTNAGVCYHKCDIYCQSKKSIITIQDDNAGFAAFVEKRKDIFNNIFDIIIERYDINPNENIITIFGEFAGKGIQKKVAVSQLDKKFYIFGIKIKQINGDPSYWLDHNIFGVKINDLNNQDIFIIEQFGTYKLTIDFNEPKFYYNKMIEMMQEVEKECPVGKFFGISDIGEGLVFTTTYKDNVYRWKVKGEKHAGKLKNKIKKKVDNVKLQKIIDICEQVTPQWRLVQMYDEVFDVINGGTGDIKKTGDYLRALINDIWKEDKDIIIDAGLCNKDVNSRISKIGREYFMDRLNEEVMGN